MASSAGGSCCHLHFNSTLDCPSRHAAHPTPSSPSLLAQGKCDPDSPPARRLSLLPAPADAAGGPTARGELARLLRHTLARARPGANPALRLVRAVRRLLLHAKRAAAVEAAAALDVGEPEPDWGAAGGAAALGPDGAVAEPGEAAAGGGDAGGGADAELAEGRGGEGGAFGVRNGPGEGQALQGGLSAASHALGAAMPEHVVDESDRERSEAAPVGTADVTKEEGGTAEHGAAGSSGQASEAACASQALPGAGAAQVAEGLPGADLSAQGTAPGGGGAEPGARSAAAPGSVSRPESEAGSPAGGAHEDGSGAGGARDAGGAGARGDPADAVDEERSSAGSLHVPAAGGALAAEPPGRAAAAGAEAAAEAAAEAETERFRAWLRLLLGELLLHLTRVRRPAGARPARLPACGRGSNAGVPIVPASAAGCRHGQRPRRSKIRTRVCASGASPPSPPQRTSRLAFSAPYCSQCERGVFL